MVFFGLVGYHNGKYVHHEKQEKECQDSRLGWRKGDLGVHRYRMQDWPKDFMPMESTISTFLDGLLSGVTSRWSVQIIKQGSL